MSRSPLVLVVVAVLLLGFVAPTGASSGDHLWTDPNVVLAPGTGPGGDYATLNGAGELEVDLSSPGVNAGSTTSIDGVFTVTNEDVDTVGVWFSHAETDEVVLSVAGDSAQDSADPVVLAPGETASVDLAVDASSRSAGELVLSNFTVHAENETASGSPSGGGGGGSTATGGSSGANQTADPTAEPPVERPPPSGEDELVYADGPAVAATFTSLSPERVEPLDAEVALDGPPSPRVDAERSPRSLGSTGLRTLDDGARLVEVGDPVALSADRTTFASADAIQPDGPPARLVRVEAPPGREHERAIIRLVVARDRLAGADPAAARIARHTGDGWQLLDTTAVEADDDRVVLEAFTPGTSVFAVFTDPAVRYRWTLPGGRTVGGPTVTTAFDAPGRHGPSVTVVDAHGRSATVDYPVLANDQPVVEIVAPTGVEPGEPVELRAEVVDEVGETTVRWHFADGSMAVGPSVERTFEAGERPVKVTVVDEYGAASSATATLVVGDVARASRALFAISRANLDAELRLVLTAVALVLLFVGLRGWTDPRPRRSRARPSR